MGLCCGKASSSYASGPRPGVSKGAVVGPPASASVVPITPDHRCSYCATALSKVWTTGPGGTGARQVFWCSTCKRVVG